jgi:hypothetical protein
MILRSFSTKICDIFYLSIVMPVVFVFGIIGLFVVFVEVVEAVVLIGYLPSFFLNMIYKYI